MTANIIRSQVAFILSSTSAPISPPKRAGSIRTSSSRLSIAPRRLYIIADIADMGSIITSALAKASRLSVRWGDSVRDSAHTATMPPPAPSSPLISPDMSAESVRNDIFFMVFVIITPLCVNKMKTMCELT